ncbi:hypothetical protein C8J28_115117 [Cereibacter azotoformans]|uniref:Uncharacterized protein n=2 Tax=Cereibacter azotoformans TaxID=43057 RepID=A0A2T5JXU2_9RHOB|nr:hypothetical protein C8J28_115117 [Cereibacter azotoformans]
MRRGIMGGGRGSKTTRRLTRQARNAVAIVAALRKAGMTIELASSILEAVPVIASHPTEVVDFSPTALECNPAPYGFMSMLMHDDPNGGWLPQDNVPWHIMHRYCRPIARIGKDIVSTGDIAWLSQWKEDIIGGIPHGWRSLGAPVYRPEIDPIGRYDFGNDQPDNHEILDYHFHVVNGRWVFGRYIDIPEPREYALDIFQAAELGLPQRFEKGVAPRIHIDPLAKIHRDGKTVTYFCGDDEEEAAARKEWRDYRSKLDINASLAVREMKRVAYGLIPPP